MDSKVFFEGEFGKICGVLNDIGGDEIVIIVHGFSSNKETSAKVNQDLLTEIGLSSIRIDLDDFGESELNFRTGATVPNYVKQVLTTIDFVKFKEVSLLGSSFGGVISLVTAMQTPIKRIFLRAPLVDVKKHYDNKYGDQLSDFEKTGFISRAFGIKSDHTYETYSTAIKPVGVTCPIMAIIPDADEVLNVEDMKADVLAFPNAEIHIIPGADHSCCVGDDNSEGISVLKEFFSKSF